MSKLSELALHHLNEAASWRERAERLLRSAEELEQEARVRRARAAAWVEIADGEDARAEDLTGRKAS